MQTAPFGVNDEEDDSTDPNVRQAILDQLSGQTGTSATTSPSSARTTMGGSDVPVPPDPSSTTPAAQPNPSPDPPSDKPQDPNASGGEGPTQNVTGHFDPTTGQWVQGPGRTTGMGITEQQGPEHYDPTTGTFVPDTKPPDIRTTAGQMPNTTGMSAKDVFMAAIKAGKKGEDVVKALNDAGYPGLAYYPDSGEYGATDWYAAPDANGNYFTVDRTKESGTSGTSGGGIGGLGIADSSNMIQQILAEIAAAQSGAQSPLTYETLIRAMTAPQYSAPNVGGLMNAANARLGTNRG